MAGSGQDDLREATRALARELEALQRLKARDAARTGPDWHLAEICTAGWLGGIALLVMAALIPGTIPGMILLAGGIWLAMGSLTALLILRYGNRSPRESLAVSRGRASPASPVSVGEARPATSRGATVAEPDFRTRCFAGTLHGRTATQSISVTYAGPDDQALVGDFTREEFAELAGLAEQAWPGLADEVARESARRQAIQDGLHPFDPDWCLAPAVLLREWLRENHLSARLVAVAAAGRSRRDQALAMIGEVLDRKPLTLEHARLLAAGTGVPVRFWQALETGYRAGLAAGKTDATQDDAG